MYQLHIGAQNQFCLGIVAFDFSGVVSECEINREPEGSNSKRMLENEDFCLDGIHFHQFRNDS